MPITGVDLLPIDVCCHETVSICACLRVCGVFLRTEVTIPVKRSNVDD